jgi:hypothetical protein
MTSSQLKLKIPSVPASTGISEHCPKTAPGIPSPPFLSQHHLPTRGSNAAPAPHLSRIRRVTDGRRDFYTPQQERGSVPGQHNWPWAGLRNPSQSQNNPIPALAFRSRALRLHPLFSLLHHPPSRQFRNSARAAKSRGSPPVSD